MILRTDRLWLREMTEDDLPALRRIMQDPVTMTAYEGAFTDEEIGTWIARQRARYRTDGFGLWAVHRADDDDLVGQCGLTLQSGTGTEVLEVGYLFRRDVWGQGLATETAAGCVAHAFETMTVDDVHAQVRDINIASMNVAIRLGMTVRERFVKHYRGVTMPHFDFAISRRDWERRKRQV